MTTARDYAATGPDYSVCCEECGHTAYADLAAIVSAGKGDVPLRELRFRCRRCGSAKTNGVVTGARATKPPTK